MATALLVLDMLTDFTSGKLANPAATQITEPIAELIQAARLRDNWIVVYGNDAHRPGDFELSVFGEHAMADSPGAAVIEELAPLPGDIIVPKRYYSAFTETDLDATCRVHRIERTSRSPQAGTPKHKRTRCVTCAPTMARRSPALPRLCDAVMLGLGDGLGDSA